MSTTTLKPKQKKKTQGSNGSSFDNLEIFLLHLPTTIWYLIFCYAPMFGIVIAFKNYKVRPGKSFLWNLFINPKTKWAGFENFEFLFGSSYFGPMLRNTLVYNMIFIVLGVVLPVTLAIMMSQLYSRKLAKTAQTMMFLPHFMSWVVISYFIYAFLATDRGLVNNLFKTLGVQLNADGTNMNWYQNVGFWTWFLVFLNVYKSIGYNMVVYLATISGIDSEMYEAALIDGASKWQQTRFITLPCLRPIISIMFIMAVGNIFRSDFGLFYQAPRNSGALVSITQTIDVYVYKALLERPNINLSSAAALVQSVCGCITIILANLVVKKIDPEAGLF